MRQLPWRGVVTIVLSLVWVYGLGCIIALVLGWSWRRSTTGELDRRLRQVGVAVAALGLVLFVAGTLLLRSSRVA